jgi:uncharacterized protein (DUF58 family)
MRIVVRAGAFCQVNFMLSRDLRRQIRRLQLRARRAVEDLLGGAYRSVFKGSGIAFEEVREYQPGDDIRGIDWNVTARMGHPFVKRFIEERELTVLLLLDVSASTDFGTRTQVKREVAAELAALLAFAAIANNDKVGFVALSDRVEKYVPPRKGTRHALRLIRDILFHEAQHPGTCLAAGLDFVNRVLRRRAIVFLLSDFDDAGYEKALRRTARRHDLIGVYHTDPLEERLPGVGLVQVQDPEAGRSLLVDTSNPGFRREYERAFQARRTEVRQQLTSVAADSIEVSTDGSHLDALVRFFRLRERRLRHV